MSRIINSETSEDCKPWRAPDLDNTSINDNSYDFNSTGPHSGKQREQQKILQQQAYDESHAKGYKEGMAQGQKELNKQIESLQSLINALTMPLPDLDNLVVDELVQLCMAVVKQMVRRELKISPGEVVAVVRQALSLLPVAASEITLELHPEDAKLIRNALLGPDAESSWKINEDPLLTRGGCRVLTRTSRIDATVEKRINSVIAEVMGGERKVDHT